MSDGAIITCLLLRVDIVSVDVFMDNGVDVTMSNTDLDLRLCKIILLKSLWFSFRRDVLCLIGKSGNIYLLKINILKKRKKEKFFYSLNVSVH